jgi:chromosome segregation ATPase
MADRKFQIQLSSSFSPEGTQKAAEGLKQVGETGKHSAEGLFESHREVHKLMHAIGNEAVPGMGQAIAALAHGPLGALIAVSLAVEFLKKNIEETNKRLDEMSASASKAFGGGDSLTDYVKATAEAASQTQAIAEAIKKASDAGSKVTDHYKNEAAAIHEVVEALKAKLKAEGKDVPGEALDNAEAQAMQHARQSELAERQGKQESLNSSAAATATPAQVVATRNERVAELSGQEAALAKATSEVNTQANDELNEKIEEKKRILQIQRGHLPEDVLKQYEAEIAQLERETAEGRIEAAKKRIEQLSRQVGKDAEHATEEKSARDEATNAATENAKRVVALQKEIAAASAAAAIKAESVSQLVSDLHNKGAGTPEFEKAAGVDNLPGAESFVQQFSASQSRLSQHHGTVGDSQTIQLMNQLLQASKQSDQGMYQILLALIQQHGQQIADLWQKLSAIPTMRGSVTGQ